MAAGLPVVATRRGGNPELVANGECGYLFPPGRSDELAGLLARYADDPALRRAHGAAARRRVEERFGVRQMVERYEDVYRRVATQPPGVAFADAP
jgi:glycosyltransferase involved in cell wall biosynthesis